LLFAGEVGLGGEIEHRILEAEKLGFKTSPPKISK
jgi:predicted ATP-dependent serine protease